VAAEQPLRTQIDEAVQQLDGLDQELRAIDGELADLAALREQYGLAAGVCDSLEKLNGLGAPGIFWGQLVDGTKVAEHLGWVRECVAAFDRRVQGIEDKRRSILDNIREERDVLDILDNDLFEAQEAEETRLNEWIIEREPSALPYRAQQMPWSRGGQEDRQFRKLLTLTLLYAIWAGTITQVVDLPLPEAVAIVEVPERLARLIERDQRRSVPPPAIVQELPEPLPTQPQPEPEEVVAERPPINAPAAEEEGAPAPAVAQAPPRARAEAAGILAFRESFNTIATRRPSARIGSQARIGNTGDASIGPPERSMVTTLAPGSSGGINLSSFSRELGGDGEGGGGGSGIAGVEVGRIASSIGGGGGGLGGNGPGGAGIADRASGGGAIAGRTDEEIQIVFDRYKAALYRLYNRELRNDPTLRGQMVLRLTIEPDGSVSMCELHGTDMNAPTLAAQVVERVRTFAFGAKDVAALTILYPIDFLPAA
jgi:hypothetical protein